jgi:hypothetical protein
MLPRQSEPGDDVPAEDERERKKSKRIQLRLVETRYGVVAGCGLAFTLEIQGLCHIHSRFLTLREV